MKQSWFYAKVCDGEFNKKHMGVNLFHCNFVSVNKFEHFCAKGTIFVSRCWGLLLEDFGIIARSFDKWRMLMAL